MSLGALSWLSSTARERLSSRPDQWDRIVSAAVAEFKNSLVAGKILPCYGPVPDALTVPQDSVAVVGAVPLGALQVTAPYAVVPLQEIWVEFVLSEQHLSEPDLATANTMLQRAARLLAQAEDLVVFQGSAVYMPATLQRPFGPGGVKVRDATIQADGLLNSAAPPAVPVPAVSAKKWGDNAFFAVVSAETQLIGAGNNQPFALALPPAPYADTYAPTATGSPEIPADRIKPLVTGGLYATSALPQDVAATTLAADITATTLSIPVNDTMAFSASGYLLIEAEEMSYTSKTANAFNVSRRGARGSTATNHVMGASVTGSPVGSGVFISPGGGTMDLIVGKEPAVTFTQEDLGGMAHFRMYTRFALRVRVQTAIARLDFMF